MNIKDNILYILKKRGMTQVELAEKMGVSKQQIQAYLRGSSTVTSLQKVAIALDTTLETIVSEVPLSVRNEAIPSRAIPTTTTLVCPHCGKEIIVIAKG